MSSFRLLGPERTREVRHLARVSCVTHRYDRDSAVRAAKTQINARFSASGIFGAVANKALKYAAYWAAKKLIDSWFEKGVLSPSFEYQADEPGYEVGHLR